MDGRAGREDGVLMVKPKTKLKVRVYHDFYGCETGCCGHVVELEGHENRWLFEFTHPHGEEFRTFARELAEQKIGEEFPECLDSIDWESLVFDEVIDD